MALRRTMAERPDLIAARGGISEEERRLLDAESPVRHPLRPVSRRPTATAGGPVAAAAQARAGPAGAAADETPGCTRAVPGRGYPR